MVTDHLITFTLKPGSVRDFLFRLDHWRNELVQFGYLVPQRCASWRSPEDDHVVVCKWLMTGGDAFRHAWSREARYDELSSRNDVEACLAKPPLVQKLKTGETVRSCRCPRSSQGPLDLWCNADSCPPLMCCRGGCIAMYLLPLSTRACVMLQEWNELVTHLRGLAFQAGDRPPEVKAFVAEAVGSKTSFLASMTRDVGKIVKKETGRKIRMYVQPYHIFAYPFNNTRL